MGIFGFGSGILEFKSVHSDFHISSRLDNLSMQLKHLDREYESVPKEMVRRRFHILKQQNNVLNEMHYLAYTRRIRIISNYKEMLKYLEDTHKESKNKFSSYQKEVEKKFKDSVTITHFNPHHLAQLKRNHDEAKVKLNQFHENIRGLTAEIERYRTTMKDGSKTDLRGGKAIFYNA